MTTGGYELLTPPRPKQKLVHIHAGAEELGRVYAAELMINSSMACAAPALALLEPPASPRWRERTAAAHADYEANLVPTPVAPLDMAEVVRCIDRHVGDDAIFTNGAGNFAGWLSRFHRFAGLRHAGRTHLAPTSGAMGYGVPAAIAASLLAPKRTVINIAGDGDFLMNGQEFATAVHHDIPLIVAVIALLWVGRSHLSIDMTSAVTGKPHPDKAAASASSFGFLAIPAVWMCFGFFFLYAVVISGIQTFAPEAARQLHGVPLAWAAMCLTFYMVASAGGMVLGGFLATDPSRCEKIVGTGFGIAATIALVVAFSPVPPMAVPVLFALMGVASGVAGPSRDLIVKRAAPPNATGRVYGVVYSGLDIGQAIAPLVFGPLLDMHRPSDIWLGIAIAQALLITTAFNVHRARRTALTPATA